MVARITAKAPDCFVRDMQKVDEIASRPGALVFDDADDWQGFNPAVVSDAELSLVYRLQSFGWANGWLEP